MNYYLENEKVITEKLINYIKKTSLRLDIIQLYKSILSFLFYIIKNLVRDRRARHVSKAYLRRILLTGGVTQW